MHGMIQTMVSAATSAMARQITSLWDRIRGLCNHNIASMMTRLPPDFLMELPANLGRLAYRYYYRETNEMMVQALERRSHRYRFAGFGFSATLVLLYALALLTGCGSYVPSEG